MLHTRPRALTRSSRVREIHRVPVFVAETAQSISRFVPRTVSFAPAAAKTAESLLSPEARLALLPVGSPARHAEIASLLAEPLDWKRLLMLAQRELSALPLWRAIRDAGLDPATAESRMLRQLAFVWEFKLLHLERLTMQTMDAFRRAGIDAVLLKGAAAALQVHGGFTRRPMKDVDVLVDPARAREAWTLAQGLGWRWDARRYPMDAYDGAHHLPPLHDAFGANAGLEIHTALRMGSDPFRFSAAEILDAAVEVEVDGRSLRVPRLDHQLLHCCIHFAWSHGLSGHAWRTFSDVDAFVASGQIDWDGFVGRARESRAETCCYWTLRLARTLAGVAVPDEVLRELRPGLPGFLLDRLARHFALNLLPGADACPSLAVQKRLWMLAIKRGRRSGIRLPSTPPPKEFRARLAHQASSLVAWLRYLRRLA